MTLLSNRHESIGADSSGLLVGDEVIPGTEWIRRDPRAWWSHGERGTRKRAAETNLLVGHWTAGHPHTGESAGPRVVRAMKARKRADGSMMEVGITFVISWDGLCWQTAPLDTAMVHAGRAINPRSIGVECCWPGTAKWARRLGYEPETARVLIGGRRVEVMLPSAALLTTWVRLAETLAGLDGLGGVRIPRRAIPDTRRLTARQQRQWTGAQEHAHVSSSRKIDAAGLLVGALIEAGWASA